MIHWNSTSYQYLVLLTDVYLSLDGTVIPNHGYVEIGDIGSISDSALLCHTNFPPPSGSATSGGDWLAPDGTRVSGTDVPGFARTRGSMVVRLLMASGTPPEGIYHCSVKDAASTFQTSVYVGLYNTEQGKACNAYATINYSIPTGAVALSGGMNFTLNSDLNGDSPQFTLTCISTGGPATTVTWARGNDNITEGTETELDDGVTARYTHTLTVNGTVGGLYTCTVANRVSNESSKLNVAGKSVNGRISIQYTFHVCSPSHPPAPSPPSNVSVSQNGLNSLRVTWTPSQGPDVTGYTIYYQQQDGGVNSSLGAGQTETSITIPGLIAGATYSISIVATSSTLPSTVTTGHRATIGILLLYSVLLLQDGSLTFLPSQSQPPSL